MHFNASHIPLIIFLVLAVLLSSLFKLAYQQEITDNQQQAALNFLYPLLPPNSNQIKLFSSRTNAPLAHFADLNQTPQAFKIMQDNQQQTGVLLFPVRTIGYQGLITLAIGITKTGKLTGVRVHEHRETEGLGDQIDIAISDWITQFKGHSLDNAEWEVTGKTFDGISGATITNHSVLKAIQHTLKYHSKHQEELYGITHQSKLDNQSPPGQTTK